MAAEHKSAYEKVEQDLKTVEKEYKNLLKELDEKEAQLESYQEGNGESPLLSEVKDLREEIEQAEREKADMEDQIQRLERDAAQLIEKDGKVAKERSEERKKLQEVYSLHFRILISGH